MNLERLRDAELAKRLLLLGVVAMLYAAGWMLFAHQGGRVGVSEGTVVKIYQGAWYTLTHNVGTVEYTASPGRIPDALGRPPVGSTMTLYFYRNDPANAFFERRQHPWPPLIAALLLLLGAFLAAEGGRRWRRSRPEKTAVAPAELEIPIVEAELHRSVIGGIFLVLGGLVVVLTTWLGWTSGGPPGLGALVIVVFSHGLVLGSLLQLFYRSGLAFDPARGLLYTWRGLPRRSFFRYRSLASLEQVSTAIVQYRRSRTHVLRLHFEDGSRWGFGMDDAEEAARMEELIRTRMPGWRSPVVTQADRATPP